MKYEQDNFASVKIYNDKNLGLYQTARKAIEIIYGQVEYSIFLEDDIIPSVSYFQYCAELLEKYKNVIDATNYYEELVDFIKNNTPENIVNRCKSTI